MKKYNIRPIVLIIVIIIIVMSIFLITIKSFDDNDKTNKKSNIEQSEVIRVISDDGTMMIENVITEKSKSEKYLVFDTVKLDKTINNIKFSIVLEYDGDSVFEDEVFIDNFGSNDSVNKRLKLSNLQYDFDELSVVLKIIEKNNIKNES